MFLRRVDKVLLLQEAARRQLPIRVVRMPTAIPVRQGNLVVMSPAVELGYSIEFQDEREKSWSWGFTEERLADERGRVDLRGTLWDQLATGEVLASYTMVRRSGSID